MSGNIDKIAVGNANLLLLAEILEEADARHAELGEPAYRQDDIAHGCGTPACALGHWLASKDDNFLGHWIFDSSLTINSVGERDFALGYMESEELFSEEGCGLAANSKQAAAYIRDFVARRTPIRSPSP